MRQHEFIDGKCKHCGGHHSGDLSKLVCVWRGDGPEPPRAVPPSIFAGDISHIGERAAQIRAEEDTARASPLDPAAPV